MDEIVEHEEYGPGLMHLRLNINDETLTVNESDVNDLQDYSTVGAVNRSEEENAINERLRDLSFRYETIKSDLIENDVPDTVAALNFIGLLAYRLNNLSRAIDLFEMAMAKDPENVNAIQNLAMAYAKSKESSKAETFNYKVKELLGRTDPVLSSDKAINHRIAISLAEHGYANAYDISLNSVEKRKERLQSAIRLYDRALSIGSSTITVEERRRWYFVMTTIFVRLDTLMMCSKETSKMRLPGFNRSLHIIKEVAKSDVLYQKVLSWAYLGIFLERQSMFENTPMAIHDCGFTGLEPIDCYSKAISIADKNTAGLNRLAKVFQVMRKHELAIGAASISIDADGDPANNFSPYNTRAKVYTSMYMQSLRSCKLGSSDMPERSLLEKAQEDLSKVVTALPSLRSYMDMGQVFYYMGVDAIKESFVVNDDYINKSLNYFSKALNCEMGKTLPELQLLRGKCMRVKGEESNALECFKQAIEMDRKGSKNVTAFRCLLETLVMWYCHGGGQSSREEIIEYVDYWVNHALNKYDNQVLMAEFRVMSQTFLHELLHLCKGAIKAGKLCLPKLCFSMFPTQPTENEDDEELEY